jgi:hypothetical protein
MVGMRALTCAATTLACLAIATSSHSQGDDPVRKWLIGRWAFQPEGKTDSPKASAPNAKIKARAKSKAKRQAARRVEEELPRIVIEFTKTGSIRLDGDASALGSDFRFIKPLAEVSARVSPETRNIKINYEIKQDHSIDVSADHTWLLEKLSAGGGAIPPERARQLQSEFRPRETVDVAVDSKTLTLTNSAGQSLHFRRYTGATLAAEEARRRGQDIKNAISPFQDILRQQGINVGPPGKGKPASRNQ